MTIEESQAKDQPMAKNVNRYQQMVSLMSNADTKKDLDNIALLFGFDMSYDRGDICLAIHTVERARGW